MYLLRVLSLLLLLDLHLQFVELVDFGFERVAGRRDLHVLGAQREEVGLDAV